MGGGFSFPTSFPSLSNPFPDMKFPDFSFPKSVSNGSKGFISGLFGPTKSTTYTRGPFGSSSRTTTTGYLPTPKSLSANLGFVVGAEFGRTGKKSIFNPTRSSFSYTSPPLQNVGKSIDYSRPRSKSLSSIFNPNTKPVKKKNLTLTNKIKLQQEQQQQEQQQQEQEQQQQQQQQQQQGGNKKKPSKKETTLSKKETTPSKKETTPSKKETNPSKKETNPSKKETNPSKKETNPSKKETNPPKKEKKPSKK